MKMTGERQKIERTYLWEAQQKHFYVSASLEKKQKNKKNRNMNNIIFLLVHILP